MKKRHITTILEQSLALFPAVLLNGARQVGKSTLVHQLVDQGAINHYVTLDNVTSLSACKADPQGFLNQFSGSVAIDEVQRCPELLVALKHNIDLTKKPGQFLLTGSANILSHPKVCDSLAGRMDIISLEALSISEINDTEPSSFLTDIFSGIQPNLLTKWREKIKKNTTLKTRQELTKAVFLGGFPDVVLKDSTYFTNRWFNAYFSAYTERDVECGLDQRTINRYLEILNITFQISILQPFFANIQKRLVKTPKVFVNDSGYACFTAGFEQIENLSKGNAFGHLLETWVYAELRKLINLQIGIKIFFYRTHLGREIDFILTKGNSTVAIECKATESINHHHLSSITEFQTEVPNTTGILLYSGKDVVQLAENIFAVPFGILG